MVLLASSAPPTVLPRARLAAAAGALFLAFLVVAAFAYRAGPLRVDRVGVDLITSRTVAEVFGLLPHSRSLGVFTELASLGGLIPAVFMVTAMATVAFARRDRPAVMLAVLGPLSAAVVMTVAKSLVDRVRDGSLMFPSGHTTVAASIAVAAAILVYRWYGGRRLLALAPVLALLPIAVGLGVVRINWHYPTDAVGGVLLGTAVVLAVAAALPERWPPAPFSSDRESRATGSVPAAPPQR